MNDAVMTKLPTKANLWGANGACFVVVRALVMVFIMWGLRTEAQTNAVVATNTTPIITTNYETAVPWFREVNGQLYNTSRSVLWKQFKGDITDVSSNRIILRTFTNEPVYSAATRSIMVPNWYGGGPAVSRLVPTRVKTGENKVYGRTIVIEGDWKSLTKFDLAVGEPVQIHAMRVGTIKHNDLPTELWSIGKPHIVAVVSTNYPVGVKH